MVEPQERPKAASEQLKTAVDYFKSFPNELPGAEKIEKISVEKAQHCFVHIRQFHPVGELKTREEMEDDESDLHTKVRTIHTSIHAVLGKIEQLYPRLPFYLEGLPRGMESDFINTARKENINKKQLRAAQRKAEELNSRIQETVEMLKKEGKTTPENRKFLNELQDQIGTLRSQLQTETGIAKELQGKERDADTLLLSSRDFIKREKIELRGAEDRDTFLAAVDSYESGDKNKKITHEMREDKLLEIIRNDKAIFAVTMYGGSHDWRDTIDRWNRSHPNEQFSLIVITPKNYE